MRRMRISAIVWIVSVLVAMGLLAWMGTAAIPSAREHAQEGSALIGGPFTLVDASGKTVTNRTYAGKYMLVYFGYTHCPDMCPTGLMLISNALGQLDEKTRAKIVPIFVTLDPERDTPAVMGDYVRHFGSGLVGLTGSPQQIKQVAEAYKVYYSKVENEGSALGYLIDHSGYMYLMGPDGRYVTHFTYQISESALKDGLAKSVR